jgi:glutathione S-transferase
MRLYNLDASPFAARVRILLRVKDAAIAMIPPPGGAASAEFRAITPLGKVPALALDDGRVLPESEVICGYLDALLPGPALLPADPVERSHVALIVRLVDLYVAPGMIVFFKLLFTDPGNRATLAAMLPEMARGLKYLDLYTAPDRHASHQRISQADAALAPMLFYVAEVLPTVIGENLLQKRQNLLAYWEAVQTEPHVAPVLAEMRNALTKYGRMLQAMQQSAQQ